MEHLGKNSEYTIDDIITHFQNEKVDPVDQIPSIYNLLKDQRLQPYFSNIEKYLNYTNIVFVKKYQLLRSGLYILLSGFISFMSYQNSLKKGKHIRKQTEYTVKNGSNSINIQEQFSVFQSSQQNCVAFQDSYLLYVKEQQALQCKFYELYQLRMDLLSNYYLSKDHQSFTMGKEIANLMNVNIKIHSCFKFRTYNFRQSIVLNNAGVVYQGRAKLKVAGHKGYEFEKYGVMLPDLAYQVTSSQIKIMVLIQTQQQIMRKINLCSFKKHQTRGSHPHILQSRYPSKFNTSFTFSKDKNTIKTGIFSRDKDMNRMAKQSENYAIISSTLYKKKLQYAKSQNIIKNTKHKKEKRYKSPLILFQIVNNKSRLAIPNFCDTPTSPSFPTSRQNSKYIENQQKTNYQKDQKIAFLHKVRISTKEYARLLQKYSQKQMKENYPEQKKIVFPSYPKKYTKKQLQIQDLHQNFVRYGENS